MLSPELADMVRRALAEDVRSGDVTTSAVVPPRATGRARLVAREALLVAGMDVAGACFRELDPSLHWQARRADGERAERGDVVAEVSGSLASILIAERTALNFLQRASGIATATRVLVDLVAGTGVAILDTRKTAPGLRLLDKHAVAAGGGARHRVALDDMILVKDNHVAIAGSVTVALERALAAAGHALQVEIEVDSLDQLDEILRAPQGPDAVLLDNFTPDEVRQAVDRVAGRFRLEVSGGITHETIRAFAEAGPDAISVGALTHSVRAADIGLDLEPSDVEDAS